MYARCNICHICLYIFRAAHRLQGQQAQCTFAGTALAQPRGCSANRLLLFVDLLCAVRAAANVAAGCRGGGCYSAHRAVCNWQAIGYSIGDAMRNMASNITASVPRHSLRVEARAGAAWGLLQMARGMNIKSPTVVTHHHHPKRTTAHE